MDVRLTPEEKFEVFGDFDPDRYAEEVEQRWGGTDAYKESQRRTAALRSWRRPGRPLGKPPSGDQRNFVADAHRRALAGCAGTVRALEDLPVQPSHGINPQLDHHP